MGSEMCIRDRVDCVLDSKRVAYLVKFRISESVSVHSVDGRIRIEEVALLVDPCDFGQ